MSNHVTEWLSPYLDGELRGRQLQQVEEHLGECEACQAEMDSLQGLSAMLHEVPGAEFISNERFVSQVNLRLPQRKIKAQSSNTMGAGWWMIPVGLLAAWIFVITTTLVSDVVSTASRIGLLDSTTASFVSTAPGNADLTARLEQVGVLKGSNLQWAERSEGFTRNVLPQFILHAAIAFLYLTWIAIWWARRTRQGHGQLLEG
jgi:predicted anti-sigma-YlaC factor YlaD